MKLRALARSLLSAYLIVAALLVAALGGTALLLWRQGILDLETMRKIGKVLRRQPVGDEVKVEVPPEEFARDIERMRRVAEEELARRRRDLEKQEAEFKLVHETVLEGRAAELKTREALADAREKSSEAQIADREAALRADELARTSKNFKLDLDLLSRLDPKEAAGMLKEMWLTNPDRVLLLIRSLRSRVSGEIYAELLKLDKVIALTIQQNLTEAPSLSPSELKRVVARLSDWDEEDLVALLRQMPKPEQEAFVLEIASTNATLGETLRGRLSIPR